MKTDRAIMNIKIIQTNHKIRNEIAKIIFDRISAQISGVKVTDTYWDAAFEGWLDNPALFPMIESCIDASEEICKFIPNKS